jgi:hypothetical protein
MSIAPSLSMVRPQLFHRERASDCPRKVPSSCGGISKVQGICNPLCSPKPISRVSKSCLMRSL